MTINFNTLFNELGAAFNSGNVANTAVGTTIASAADAYLAILGTPDVNDIGVSDNVRLAVETIRVDGASFNDLAVSDQAKALIIAAVENDTLDPHDIDSATKELIRQMEANTESIQDNAVGSSQATLPPFTTIGDGVILINVKRGDGLVNSLSFAEGVTAIVTARTSTEEATFALTSDRRIDATANPTLRFDWPGGSEVTTDLTSLVSGSSSNLIVNGSFETADLIEKSLPSGWIERVGGAVTEYKISDIAVNRIVVSGTPTTGSYTISWVNKDGNQQTTIPISFDAASIKSALNALDGLETVTVVTTGTIPDFQHDVSMVDVPNPLGFSVINNTDGTVTPSQVLAGSAQVVRKARALEYIGTATLTQLSVPVTLATNTIYGLSVFLSVDVVPAAGVLEIELIDGSTGTVITDDEGVTNSLSVTLSSLTSTITQSTLQIITPNNLPGTVHITLRLSTALSVGSSLFVDEMTLAPMTQLYVGGPSLVAFTGKVAWDVDDGKALSITNDLTDSQFHRWFQRTLGIQVDDVLFPVNASPTQADSKIT